MFAPSRCFSSLRSLRWGHLCGVGVLSLTVCAATLPAQTTGSANTAGSDPVVITVGTLQVHASQFQQLLNGVSPEQRAAIMAHQREVAQEYGRMLVMTQEAQRRGLDHNPQFLFEMQMMRNKALATELVSTLRDESKPTAAQIKAYYDAHPDEFMEVRARHILIADADTPGGASKLTPAQAEAKIQDISARLKKGEDFATLAKQDSDDPGSKTKGGELGFIGYGQTVPEFQKQLWALPVGQTSAPFQTRFGYHIVQVEEHRQVPLDKASADIEQQLASQAVREKMAAISKSTPVVLNDSYFAAQEPAPAQKPAAPATAQPPR